MCYAQNPRGRIVQMFKQKCINFVHFVNNGDISAFEM